MEGKESKPNTESSSKFIKITKAHSKVINKKNVFLMVIMAFVCLVIIFETEYFFISAHEKFKAYIDIKE
jgi:hypothetical protein